jgi:hypothetical protein
VQSANLNGQVEDPQGCTGETNTYCNQGQCVPSTGGTCVQACTAVADNPNTPNTDETACNPNGGPSGCNPGWHGTVTAACAYNKAVCGGTCKCDLN